MINIIGILVTVILFHIFVYPMVRGFIDGYNDARNGNPYNDNEEERENS